MILRDLYVALWGDKFLTTLSSGERFDLYQNTIGYCFRYVGANAFAAELVATNEALSGSYTNKQLRDWARDNLLYNGYMMRNVKFFIFAKCTRSDKTQHQCALRFAVDVNDMCLTDVLKDSWIAHMKKIRASNTELNLYCMDSYNKLLERVWDDNDAWCARFTWRKLRFIAQSTGMDIDDLKLEIMTEGLRAVNHTWPKLPCELYAHNLFKRTVHNVGINLIDRGTSMKHARLVQDGEGWASLNVDYDNLSNNQGDDSNLCIDTRLEVDCKVDMNKFMDTLSDKKRMFMQSLVGTHIQLSEWMTERQLIADHQDNEDLLRSRGLTNYLKTVSLWLGIENRQAKLFLQQMRNHFKVYHEPQ